jgi:hypothetical protein
LQHCLLCKMVSSLFIFVYVHPAFPNCALTMSLCLTELVFQPSLKPYQNLMRAMWTPFDSCEMQLDQNAIC